MTEPSSKRNTIIIGTAVAALLIFALNLAISLLAHDDAEAIIRGAAWILVLILVMVALVTRLEEYIKRIEERVEAQPKFIYADRESLHGLLPADSEPLPIMDVSAIKKERVERLVDQLSGVRVRRTRRRT